jgi:hypothetical protein
MGVPGWAHPGKLSRCCKFSEANLFSFVGLAHADPSTMIQFPTELFNLSESA